MTTLTFHVTSLNPFLVARMAAWPSRGPTETLLAALIDSLFHLHHPKKVRSLWLSHTATIATDHKPSGSDISWWERHHRDKDTSSSKPSACPHDCPHQWCFWATACRCGNVLHANSSWDVWQAVCEQKSRPKSSPSPPHFAEIGIATYSGKPLVSPQVRLEFTSRTHVPGAHIK